MSTEARALHIKLKRIKRVLTVRCNDLDPVYLSDHLPSVSLGCELIVWFNGDVLICWWILQSNQLMNLSLYVFQIGVELLTEMIAAGV